MKAHKLPYFASCAFGLEESLQRELSTILIQVKMTPSKGGVYFDGTRACALKVLLKTRIASRIYEQISSFQIKSEDDLYYQVKDIPWPKKFSHKNYIKVNVTQSPSTELKKPSKFKSTMYLAQKIKDGIVDRFRANSFDRPSIDTKTPDIIIHAHIAPNDNPHSTKERVLISIDLCTTALSNRGFRPESNHVAPLRENVAAAILETTNWDASKEGLCDLMCGTGTMLYEALTRSYNLSPQWIKLKILNRNIKKEFWGFQRLLGNDDSIFSELVKKEHEQTLKMLESTKYQIIGIDNNSRCISNIRETLSRLKLSNHITLYKDDSTKINSNILKDFQNGYFFANPPYGERMGNEDFLDDLYKDLGENLKSNFQGSRLNIISTNKKLLKKIAMKPDQRHFFRTGAKQLELACYNLNPRGHYEK